MSFIGRVSLVYLEILPLLDTLYPAPQASIANLTSPNMHTQESYFEPEFLEAVRYAQSEHSSPEGLMDYIQEEDGKLELV